MGSFECKCDKKSWLISSIVVAVAYALMEYIVHHKVLLGLYKANAHLWRTPQDIASKLCWAWISYVLFGLLFTCIYSKGYEPDKAGPSQGLRYGFLLGLLYWGVSMLGCFPFCPWPTQIFQSWFAFGMAEFAICGVLVGLIYKPKA